MKAVAVKTFINKYSKALVKKGDTVELNEKRFKEINEAGHGILLIDEKEKRLSDKRNKEKGDSEDSEE